MKQLDYEIIDTKGILTVHYFCYGDVRMGESLYECPYWISDREGNNHPHICSHCYYCMNSGMSNRLDNNCNWSVYANGNTIKGKEEYLLRWLIFINCGEEALEKYNKRNKS